MYFDEDIVLDLRLNVLNDFVDKFVIAEATKDHTGKDKKLNFDINKYKKFKNKIIYIVVDDTPENIKIKIEKGEDIFERGYQLKKVEVDSKFPKYILDNKDKFEKWII